MDIFSIYRQVLKFLGITIYPTTRIKVFNKIIISWNFSAALYSIFAYANFSIKSTDVLEISEGLSLTFTATITTIKYSCFCIHAKSLFEIVDEIDSLNEKCKRKV